MFESQGQRNRHASWPLESIKRREEGSTTITVREMAVRCPPWPSSSGGGRALVLVKSLSTKSILSDVKVLPYLDKFEAFSCAQPVSPSPRFHPGYGEPGFVACCITSREYLLKNINEMQRNDIATRSTEINHQATLTEKFSFQYYLFLSPYNCQIGVECVKSCRLHLVFEVSNSGWHNPDILTS